MTCDNALEVCGIQSVNQVLNQQLTRPEEELEEEEEIAEHKPTFLNAFKRLEASRKYLWQFDTQNNNIVMCSEVENELYRLTTQKVTKKILTDWLKKWCNWVFVYHICQSIQVMQGQYLEIDHYHFLSHPSHSQVIINISSHQCYITTAVDKAS
jgi:hypothetical protein